MNKKLLSILLAFGICGNFFAPTTEYGFKGSTGAKISVSSSPVTENDTFYFDSEAREVLYINIEGEKYKILYFRLESDGVNFESKGAYMHKIYSSTVRGTPPSLIVKKDKVKDSKCLLYVSSNGEHKFNDKYKFDLLPLNDDDFGLLNELSRAVRLRTYRLSRGHMASNKIFFVENPFLLIEAPEVEYVKFGDEKYEIVNMSSTKETQEIKQPIYSSALPGMPESFIAKKDGKYYLMYVSLSGSRSLLSSKYKTDPVEIKLEDLAILAQVSQKSIPEGVLSNGYTVRQNAEGKCLFVLPPK